MNPTDNITKRICDFAEKDVVEGFFLLRSVQAKDNKNGKKYLDLELADATGEINAKYWNVKEEELDSFQSGTIVKIRAEVTSYLGRLQLQIAKIRNRTEEDTLVLSTLIPAAPREGEDMYEEIMEIILAMEDEDIRAICYKIYEDKKGPLLYYPAAQKNHHAIYGGLLYHLTTMLKIADSLAGIYPFINRDLLYAGVLLHDIMKIEEMDANDFGVVHEYTFEGQLLGHIIQGITLVNQLGKELGIPREKVVLLEHMILSHHNEPEYGSPKRPMIPEAELLCHIDMIDARMYDMHKALENVDRGGFSDKIWLLNNRKLYKY